MKLGFDIAHGKSILADRDGARQPQVGLRRRRASLTALSSRRPWRDPASDGKTAARATVRGKTLKIVSWNILRLTGATPEDIAALVGREKPDILLLQEASEQVFGLTELIGGVVAVRVFAGGVDGLAVWSPTPLPPIEYLTLEHDPAQPHKRRRCAMILRFPTYTLANTHLAHNQGLTRRQFASVATASAPRAIIIGDFNVVGPLTRRGWTDCGPRAVTHMARGVLPFRLDRCMVRDWEPRSARALPKGRSDHKPIVVEVG
jgi:endonuclease/exonuclease/phosphatase family metal-dependent hydrolase